MVSYAIAHRSIEEQRNILRCSKSIAHSLRQSVVLTKEGFVCYVKYYIVSRVNL